MQSDKRHCGLGLLQWGSGVGGGESILGYCGVGEQVFPQSGFLFFSSLFLSLARLFGVVFVLGRLMMIFLFYFEEFCFVLAWHGGLAFERLEGKGY